jgi:Family of unknown function (DUF5681)
MSGGKVGYRNPPLHSRFRPGQSGNPRGRPKGAKRFAALLDAELASQILVSEGGVSRTLSKKEAAVKTIVGRLLKGDIRVLQAILKLCEQDEQSTEKLITHESALRELE